jgi:hypothetical protein
MVSIEERIRENSKQLTKLNKNKKRGDKAFDVWILYRSRLARFLRELRTHRPSCDAPLYEPVKPDADEPDVF